ncbi:MAG: hypothetical protein WBA23_01765 [Tunicatimonas sp.]|uniref:hypothetical protein n=1 Tax=Tunicatimonas sp. TaxID=1940096 RepID=UPI003C79483A
MKKLCTIICLLTIFGFTAQAQSTVRVDGGDRGGGLAYDKGTNILNIGIGLGRTINRYNNYNRYSWYGYGGIGASLNASYEIGFHEYFSAGVYGGIGRYGIGNGWSSTAIGAGIRGSFHYVALANEALDLGLNEDKLDLYITVVLGAEVISYNIDNRDFQDSFGNRTGVDFGTILGGRYMLNERFGVYSELGYGALSVWTVGLTVGM